MLSCFCITRKNGKRHQQQDQSTKTSRSPSPEPADDSPCESYRPLLRTPPPSHVGPPPSPPVPTNPVAPVAPQPSGPLPLMPCPVCGRTFVPQSLAKHVKICEKMMAKKRKTFDSSRQRREGTDLEQYLPKNFGLPENSPFLEKSPPNTAKATPKPKTQSVRSAIKKPMAELQKCPHCARAFGVRAFERHVEWCADKAKILPAAAAAQPPPHIADAKQRLNARTQYKAPLARARRSSQSREKASNSRSTSVDSSRGVSPPPPREAGDGKGRPRASESLSSNDCYDDTAPHVPVIRNSRTSQNNSGDANVKARQARLARDISNTRLDDNYDPFVSAARQMKELMSSDTNIPKKLQSPPKELNRTLPTLRPNKDKTDDESLCEDFDLEEFMTTFDEEVNKQKLENKRTYSSTTRIVKQSKVFDTLKAPDVSDDSILPKALNNGMLPVNKSMSLVFSNNNVKGENLFPSSVKRSTSLLDSIQKKNTLKTDTSKSRHKADQLEQDIMQSLKDFDKFYESERIENHHSSKEFVNCSKNAYNTTKKEPGTKTERRNNKNAKMSNGHFSPSGKPSNDSAYSRLVSLNRISPSKLSLCNSKDQNDSAQLEQPQTGSDSMGGSQKDEVRSISSEEFLAMERSAELNEPLPRVDAQYKDLSSHTINEKRAASRASSQRSPLWRSRQELSSSGSDTSLPRAKEAAPPPRPSRFCHECGNRFRVDTAKFCIECGVKRLVV
ncbi:unnamed protein product, partial [Iphiclides podalirius]